MVESSTVIPNDRLLNRGRLRRINKKPMQEVDEEELEEVGPIDPFTRQC